MLPWHVNIDQSICASLYHSSYWHEVGVLKVYTTSDAFQQLANTLLHPNNAEEVEVCAKRGSGDKGRYAAVSGLREKAPRVNV